eukprot:5683355-Heterocapsa_arctica.AAC.1
MQGATAPAAQLAPPGRHNTTLDRRAGPPIGGTATTPRLSQRRMIGRITATHGGVANPGQPVTGQEPRSSTSTSSTGQVTTNHGTSLLQSKARAA